MIKYKVVQLIYKLDVGGAEKVVYSLAKGLDRRRFTPIVASFKGGALVNDLKKEGVPVYVFGKKGKFDLIFFVRLLRFFRSQKIDILHTHTFSPNFWGRIAAILTVIPVVVTTEHTIASHKSSFQRAVDSSLSRFSDKIVAVSEQVKQSNVSLGHIDSSKIIVIYNGVEQTRTRPLSATELVTFKASLGLKNDLPVILTIGRLAPPKGHSFLLEAIKLVNQEECRAQFLFVGDGVLRSDLEVRAKDLGISRDVIFAGFHTDIDKILQTADIVVFPSLREGFSIAVLEAMAAGKPIIATDVGGNKEAIESGVSGALVPPGDVNALSDALMNLIEDKKLGQRLGKRAKKRYQLAFTQLSMVNKTQQLYDKIVSERKMTSY